MSTTTETTRGTVELGNWRAGVASGIAGGLVMGALMIVMNVGVIAVAIPSLYTLAPPENPLVGLVVHVSHGATLGVAFAGLAGLLGADGVANRSSDLRVTASRSGSDWASAGGSPRGSGSRRW